MTDSHPPHGPSPDPGGSPPAADPALRRQADATYRARTAGLPDPFEASLPEAAQSLLQELRVHQIELEMQNEELRRTQVELSATRARYFDLFDLAPVGYLIVRESGLILQANLTAAAMLGKVRGALTDRPISRSIFKADQDTWYVCRKRLVDTGESQSCELRVVKPDGLHLWVRVAMSAACADDGAPLHRVTLTDIGESKLADAALRESEELFRSFFEAPGGLRGVVELETGDIIHVQENTDAARFFGRSQRELQGRRASELGVPSEAIRFWTEHYLECSRTGVPVQFEFQVPGSGMWLMVTVAPLPTGQTGRTRFAYLATDITEQKRAEDALRRNQALLLAITEGTSDAVFVKDTEGRYVLFNSAASRFVGKSVADVLGRDDTALFALEAAARVMAGDRQILASGSTQTIEETDLHTQIGAVTFLATKGPIRNAQGEITGLFGIARDITARKQAEDALRQSDERLRTALRGANAGVWECILPGWGSYWSPEYRDLYGFTADEEAQVEKWRARVHPDDLTRIESNLTAVAEPGKDAWQQEFRLVVPGRGVRWILDFVRVSRSPDGRPARVSGVNIDITDRKQAEAGLVMRDRAIQAVNQGIVITDPDLRENRIVYVSPGFERMTGYASAEVVGRNCRFLQGRDTDRAEVARIAAAVRGGVSHSGEVLNYRKDGSTFWNKLSITPVRDPDGRLVHFVGIQIDVTARRILEDQLRQAQKMEAVGQLAGGVAHDFNNLLTIIDGYTGMLLDAVTPADHSWEFLQEIKTASERAADLTGRLLTFGRRQIRNPEPLDLNSVVDETIRLLGGLLGDDVELDVLLDPHLKWVWADRGQISQILLNLAINARDSMSGGGLLSVRTENLELTESRAVSETRIEPGHYIVLSVTDTGCGMAAEVLARVFEPFFTTKPVGKGTGLGLATVHGIVMQMEGGIEILSKVGTGTSFRVYLPGLPPTYDSDNASSESQEAERGSETILLVEDDHALRKMTHLMLASHGYIVLEAASGSAALQVFSELAQSIQLLITDIGMPGMNGLELAEKIVARKPSIRVLFMSGYVADNESRDHFLRPEVCFLHKPFSVSDLLLKVREVLDA